MFDGAPEAEEAPPVLLGTVEVGDVFGALVVVDEDDETSYPIIAPTAAEHRRRDPDFDSDMTPVRTLVLQSADRVPVVSPCSTSMDRE